MTETRLALLDEQITKINKLIKYSKKYLNCKPVKEEVESFISKLEEIGASLKDQFKSEYFGNKPELADAFADDNPLANSAHYEIYVKHRILYFKKPFCYLPKLSNY